MTADEGFTERTRAEIALRESEERFRAIFETARDSVFVKDRSLRYTHVNPAMAALFDSTPAALVGVTDDALFDAETCARVREVDSGLAGRIETRSTSAWRHRSCSRSSAAGISAGRSSACGTPVTSPS
jgi:PAS domain S-box-containing protein